MKEIIINYWNFCLFVSHLVTVVNRIVCKLASLCHIVFYLIFILFVFSHFIFFFLPNYLAHNLYRSTHSISNFIAIRRKESHITHSPQPSNTNKYSINSTISIQIMWNWNFPCFLIFRFLFFSILNWIIAWMKKKFHSTNSRAHFLSFQNSEAIKIQNKSVCVRVFLQCWR